MQMIVVLSYFHTRIGTSIFYSFPETPLGKEISDRLTLNIMQLDDITNGALYFRTIKEKKQKWHLKFTIKIGNHLFYK